MNTPVVDRFTSRVRSDQLAAGMTLVVDDEDVETEWKILGVTQPENESDDTIRVRFETENGITRTLLTRPRFVHTVRSTKPMTVDKAAEDPA